MKKISGIFLFAVMNLSYVDGYSAEDDSTAALITFNYLFLGALALILLISLGHYASKSPLVEVIAEPKPGIIHKIMQAMTRSTPISKEHDIMLHHEYDGIKELNNSVPPWLNYIYIGSLVFSIFYLAHYHVFGTGKSQFDEYSAEMEVARMDMQRLMESGAFITEENVTALTDPESIAAGQEKFNKDCSPCHGMNGEGTIGPNLTDDYWIHGGKVGDLFHTVKVGVPEKGMVAWGQQLNPKQMQEVVSYVLTLNGTNPPNGKAPEGELFKRDELKTVDSTASEMLDSLNLKK